MLRLLKRVAWLGVLAMVPSAAQAFSLVIPPASEPWQVHDLGYQLTGDIVGPANIDEDYRRNTPVIYYAFDENFIGYFGSNGVWAVDQAFAILNNLRPASSYSANLEEVPLESRRYNPTATALSLMDLKSEVLNLMVEQMGLSDSIRWTWTLHNRTAGANCPVGNEWLVTMRNYDIVPSPLDQLQYSSYVNGILYSYYILDYCQNPPGGAPLSEAVEIPVDVYANAYRYAPVSATMENFLDVGGFYSGLTRDDVAGLRYLYRANHVHWEDVPTNSIVFFTNNVPTALTNLVTTNLSLLIAQSFTNDDATLLGLYPTLAIVPGSTVPTFTNVVTTNLSAYYTNSPWDPVGTPPHLVYSTNYSTNVTFVYSRSFANVVTNSYSTKGYVTVISTNLYFPPSGPVGYYTTNITTKTMLTNMVSGDYYIIPTTWCGVQILSNILTTVVGITNTVVVANINPTTNTISGNYLIGRDYITWFTNHNLAIFQVQCVTNEPSLRRGIEKITFIKTAYDSLLGQFYNPQTNYFTMTVVTNSTNWVQTYQRVVTTPDILFTARDGMPGPAQPLNGGMGEVLRNIALNSANALPNLAGPGVIEPVTTITFNKSGPIFYNVVTNGLYSMDQRTSIPLNFMWASFDDSTNPPVVYPNGTSLASVESQILMQVTSVSLPPAHLGTAYTTQLTGTGGKGPPYIWSLAPDSPLPPSWLLRPPPAPPVAPSGLLSGTPDAVGISSFFVQMTGSDGGFTVWQVTLTVLP